MGSSATSNIEKENENEQTFITERFGTETKGKAFGNPDIKFTLITADVLDPIETTNIEKENSLGRGTSLLKTGLQLATIAGVSIGAAS